MLGVVGTLYGNCSVRFCKNSADVTSTGWEAAGIVSLCEDSDNTEIIGCANLGNITCEGANVGGIAGLIIGNGAIQECYNIGDVRGMGQDSDHRILY